MKIFQSCSDISDNFSGVCKTLDDKSTFYYKNGQRHREDGPAIININGGSYWYLNGLFHRESGPAVTYNNGSKGWWYKNRYFGINNKFTNTTWIEKVKELKRQDSLKIFI